MTALRGLYAITPDCTDERQLLAMASALAAGGGRWLQYRNKTAPAAVRAAQAAALAEYCRLHSIGLIVNDDVDLALEVDAAGVHLGGDDGDLAAARRRLGAGRVLGASCYDSLPRARGAVAAGADYVALGAVFPSATKPGAVQAPLELVGAVRGAVGVPVVAIGGIRLDNAPQVVAAGADMLAVISDLFDAPDIAARAAAFQKLFD